MKLMVMAPLRPQPHAGEAFRKEGMQEYSQRQAGVTWAIVLCVLIPVVLVVVFIAFRHFRKEKEPASGGADPVMTKHSKIGSFQEPAESDKLNEEL